MLSELFCEALELFVRQVSLYVSSTQFAGLCQICRSLRCPYSNGRYCLSKLVQLVGRIRSASVSYFADCSTLILSRSCAICIASSPVSTILIVIVVPFVVPSPFRVVGGMQVLFRFQAALQGNMVPFRDPEIYCRLDMGCGSNPQIFL